ncbi:hypothetical protein Tco_0272267 [Tanacetum coccineum]
MHTSIPSPPRSPRKDLSLDICLKRVVADIVIQERDALQAQVPDLISKEFVVQAPTIIKERFKMHMKNNKFLKRKFEKSSTSSIPYRTDAFRKRDHDDYHEDDAPREGEKSAKRHKTSKGSKSASATTRWDAWSEIPIIDEDEVIPEDETSELIEEFQNTNKRVPTIYDHERIRPALRDMIDNQFRDAKENAYHLEQIKNLHGESNSVGKNPNEPPRYLYKKDFFYLKYGISDGRRYILSLHKIHAVLFLEEDLEEKMNRWVRKEFKTFIEEARLSLERFMAQDIQQKKKRFEFVEIVKFVMLYTGKEYVKEVKMKIFETELLKKAPLLGTVQERAAGLKMISRLIDGSPCGGIDMVIKYLDLDPKIDTMVRGVFGFRSPSRWKELSKDMGSEILPGRDGSCGKTFKPITSLITKGKFEINVERSPWNELRFAPTGWCRIVKAPYCSHWGVQWCYGGPCGLVWNNLLRYE